MADVSLTHDDLIKAMQEGSVLDYRFGYARFFMRDGIMYREYYPEGDADPCDVNAWRNHWDDPNDFKILPPGSPTKPDFQPYTKGISVWNDSGEI